MSDTLVINEIYLSLQGESTFAGLPCIFVRLTACNLRCSYCDSAYAFTEGEKKSLEDVRTEVRRLAEPVGQRTAEPTGIITLSSTRPSTLAPRPSDTDPPHPASSTFPLVQLPPAHPPLPTYLL